MSERIFVAEPLIEEDDCTEVTKAVKSGFVSGSFGDYITQFEKEFAQFCDSKHAITTSNGTTALHLAVRAHEIGPGDEVITSNITNIATLLALQYVGAKAVVVDCESDTWNMNVSQIKEKITPKTKAILPVHIYGHPVDMDPLNEAAQENNLIVIEDAAEAHGALYKGKKAGSLGDTSCFSFYANKIITTGEGGMIVTNNDQIAQTARDLKNLAFGKQERFKHDDIGYNYRLSNILAALGVSQLRKIDRFTEKKRTIAQWYNERLKDSGFQLPVQKEYAKNVYWMYGLLTPENVDKHQLMTKLKEQGIETRSFFMPMHRQPALIEKGIFTGQESFPISDDLYKRGFYLPSGLGLTKEQVDRVCDVLLGLI